MAGSRHKHLIALETLYKTTLDPNVSFDEKVTILLDLGRDVFGLSLGILSHIEDELYTVTHIQGPEGVPTPGTTFDLAGTYCVHTLAANEPKSFHHAGTSDIRDHPCYKNFQLESYIGAPIFVDAVRYGTLNFSDPEARDQPFSDDDHTLINLCAQWIGAEIFRRQSREALQKQMTLFESMFQSVPDSVLISDANRHIEHTNPAFSKMFGYAPEEVAGKSTAMLYADEKEWVRQGHLRYNQNGSDLVAKPVEIRFQRKDGTHFWCETVGAPLRNAEGELLGFLTAGRDITERLQASAAKQEFISVVSHELRTPLTSITGSLELLKAGIAGPVDGKAASMIDIACRNSKRLVRLINDILDADKIQSGKMEYQLEVIDVADVLAQSVDEMKGYADEFGVNLISSAVGSDVQVKADRDRLLQVLANLISNAIKVSDRDATVEVGIDDDARQCQFFVRDSGPGIPKEAQGEIYDRFTQVDSTTTRNVPGTGLGLSITQALVAHMGGGIDFETAEGEGTTFTVVMPCVKGKR